MEEVIASDLVGNKIAMNLLFLVAYEIIMSIISYKFLERYSWKECAIASLVLTFGVSMIKLSGVGFFKILITSVVQTAVMVVVEKYMYDKDYDIKDYTFRTTILNIFAFGGCVGTCLLWDSVHGFGATFKLFGIIILFIVGINALGYVLLNGEKGNGLIILVDSVIYVITLFLILRSQGIDIKQISQTNESINSLLKMIALCVGLGVGTGITSGKVYDDTDEMKSYLIISSLRTYAIDMTVYLSIIVYLMYQISNLFSSFSL